MWVHWCNGFEFLGWIYALAEVIGLMFLGTQLSLTVTSLNPCSAGVNT